MDIFEIMISMIKHILYVIIIMLIYGIKIIRKMPIFLTVFVQLCSIASLLEKDQTVIQTVPVELQQLIDR
jgi:hypothetical protein